MLREKFGCKRWIMRESKYTRIYWILWNISWQSVIWCYIIQEYYICYYDEWIVKQSSLETIFGVDSGK